MNRNCSLCHKTIVGSKILMVEEMSWKDICQILIKNEMATTEIPPPDQNIDIYYLVGYECISCNKRNLDCICASSKCKVSINYLNERLSGLKNNIITEEFVRGRGENLFSLERGCISNHETPTSRIHPTDWSN